MRTIKFRGKKPTNDVWVYGSLVYSNNLDSAIYFQKGNGREWVYVKPDTIGQFIGLCDKNGKEIYEGDIIHIKGKTIDKDFGVVTWHENGYFFVDDSFGEFPRNCKPIGDYFDSIMSNEHFKGMEFYISGNIHDNPKLLKGE